jgi:hypothetical protein
MLAFEVYVDGERLACAGADDWSVLSLIVSATRNRYEQAAGEVHLHLGGMTESDSEGVNHHLRWNDPLRELAVGNELTVRILDTDTVDPPRHRHRADHEQEEPSLTEDEIRDLRYRDYLELKQEFEPDSAG